MFNFEKMDELISDVEESYGSLTHEVSNMNLDDNILKSIIDAKNLIDRQFDKVDFIMDEYLNSINSTKQHICDSLSHQTLSLSEKLDQALKIITEMKSQSTKLFYSL